MFFRVNSFFVNIDISTLHYLAAVVLCLPTSAIDCVCAVCAFWGGWCRLGIFGNASRYGIISGVQNTTCLEHRHSLRHSKPLRGLEHRKLRHLSNIQNCALRSFKRRKGYGVPPSRSPKGEASATRISF